MGTLKLAIFGKLTLLLVLLSIPIGLIVSQATVTTSPPRNDYVGTGSLATYSYGFRIFESSDLRVTKRDTSGVETALVLTTDYTVTGVNRATGGTITLVAGNLPSGYALTIRFDRVPKQSTDLRNQGSFFAETHEAKFDELTRYAQEARDVLQRSLHIPETEMGTSATTAIPTALLRASKFVAFDTSGNLVMAAGTSANLGPVSPFIDTLLDDLTAAAALTTLGAASADSPVVSGTITGSYTVGGTYSIAGTPTLAATPTVATAPADKQYVDAFPAVVLVGGKITVTFAGSAATIAVKTNAGNNPSATDPVSVRFRSATLTDSAYTVVKITGALSTVISSGSTGGTINATPSRLYVGVLNNAGTVELCWWNPVTTTSLFAWPESGVISTTAEGGAGAADSAGVIYSTTARTSVAGRYAGYFESTQTTAGTWAQSIAVLQQMGAGVPRTGDLAQPVFFTQTGAVATGTTAIVNDDTIQQITEGNEYMTLTMTPISAINLLDIEILGHITGSGNMILALSLFQDSTANALSTTLYNGTGLTGGSPIPISLKHIRTAGTVSATTFRMRAGNSGGATTTFNGSGGARLFGGVLSSYMRIREIVA